MTDQDEATRVRIRYEAGLPQAHWGPLFHVFRMERPGVVLDWRPNGFPTREQPLLDGAEDTAQAEEFAEPAAEQEGDAVEPPAAHGAGGGVGAVSQLLRRRQNAL